jgi:hypothetical protein
MGGDMSRFVFAGLRIAVLLCVPALIAWVSGRPFIFPSLGPSAFSLVVAKGDQSSGRNVIGGHLIGIVGGLLSYHLIAHGVSLGELPAPLSLPLLRLVLSGVVSVALTGMGMLALRAEHPPACATTLIISLGLLATYQDVLYIVIGIVVMYAVHLVLYRGENKGRS